MIFNTTEEIILIAIIVTSSIINVWLVRQLSKKYNQLLWIKEELWGVKEELAKVKYDADPNHPWDISKWKNWGS